ncbi:PIN-like domain-containing protein [Photobacterium leiognathi]|uniref:PIN-like domain-containing protein n=1 Tax=Photobacterium leiognathi TaxID=553611 RepID=UPI0029818965|nr:PIN-like domain-containing protein [Photobacterium leiognathi]
MKSNFKSFYKPQDEDLTELWEKAIFVFDTNILTNLYRYQSDTTMDFLNTLEKIQNRVWIPHHVALEYQRNRLGVIEEQHNKFAETKSTINNMVNELQKKLDNLQLKKQT